MTENISRFYDLFAELTTEPPPPGVLAHLSATTKRWQLRLLQLKASIRYLLDNEKIYNEVDRCKTQKMAKLTMVYMKQNLLKKPVSDTVVLDRFQFDAQKAIDILESKHRKAERRFQEDRCAPSLLSGLFENKS